MGFVYCNPSLLSPGVILIWALHGTSRPSLCCVSEIPAEPSLDVGACDFTPFAFPESSTLVWARTEVPGEAWALSTTLCLQQPCRARAVRFLAVQWAQFQLPLKSVPGGQMAILLCARKAFSTEFIAILNLKHCDTCQKNSAACSLGQFFRIYMHIHLLKKCYISNELNQN